MFMSNDCNRVIVFAILFFTHDLCFCMNASLAGGNRFLPAVATWYSDNNGAGSGGACGLANDVVNAPYYGMISAGNNNIFRSGAGCGSCYMVKCTENRACSGAPIKVTITDECPGLCNKEAFHFDLSGKAFGSLAKPGLADVLRNAGRINIQYTRTRCEYKSNIAVKLDAKSNPYYLAFAVENVRGEGEIEKMEILYPGARRWQPMQWDWGETWKFSISNGVHGPYSIKFIDTHSNSVVAKGLIPQNWVPGKTYYSSVNFN